MKRNSFIALLGLILLGCSTSLKLKTDSDRVSLKLKQEITRFIEFEDSLISAGHRITKSSVINIDFYNDENSGNCFLKINSGLVYYKCCLKGGVIYKDRLIVFYDWRSFCSTGFFNGEMAKTFPQKYRWFENERDIPFYNERIFKYEIISPDSLKLVSK